MGASHQLINTPINMKTSLFSTIKPITSLATAIMLFMPQAHAASEKATVSGKFLGNGKDGKIQHVIVLTAEPFSDKPAIQLIFTEKDASSSKKPDWDVSFKKFGSALVVSTHQDGGVFGCEVAHSAHEKSPFSSVGRVKIKEMKVTDTTVSGVLTTGGEGDFFGQTWDVELTFSAPLPKGAFAAVSKPQPTVATEKEEPTKPTGPKLPVSKLPLPTAATDVQYKQGVEHITFNSSSSVSAVSKDFSAKLKKAGWKDAPGSLMGNANAILRRTLDGAELTIMIRPAGKGSSTQIFTQGLDWSDTPASAEAVSVKSDSSGIEAEANKLIKEALKGLPKF